MIPCGGEECNHFNVGEREKLYNTLVILVYLTEVISSSAGWRRLLQSLLATRGALFEKAMGFPRGWRSAAFWRERS